MDNTRASGAGTPKRKGQIETQVDLLESAIEETASKIGGLSSLLVPVLRQPVPQEAKACTKDSEALPQLAERIGNLAMRVRGITETIADVEERLEL